MAKRGGELRRDHADGVREVVHGPLIEDEAVGLGQLTGPSTGQICAKAWADGPGKSLVGGSSVSRAKT
jgi:hypothetical protein